MIIGFQKSPGKILPVQSAVKFQKGRQGIDGLEIHLDLLQQIVPVLFHFVLDPVIDPFLLHMVQRDRKDAP